MISSDCGRRRKAKTPRTIAANVNQMLILLQVLCEVSHLLCNSKSFNWWYVQFYMVKQYICVEDRTKRSVGENFSPTREFSRIVPLLSVCGNMERSFYLSAQIQRVIVATPFNVRVESHFMGIIERQRSNFQAFE